MSVGFESRMISICVDCHDVDIICVTCPDTRAEFLKTENDRHHMHILMCPDDNVRYQGWKPKIIDMSCVTTRAQMTDTRAANSIVVDDESWHVYDDESFHWDLNLSRYCVQYRITETYESWHVIPLALGFESESILHSALCTDTRTDMPRIDYDIILML